MKSSVLPIFILFIAHAETLVAGIYLDGGVTTGLSRPSVPQGDSPLLVQHGVNVGLGWTFLGLMLGVTSEYRLIEQYSDVEEEVGNYKGVYSSPVGPMIGYDLVLLYLKADIKYFGTYKLDKKTQRGATVEFQDPLGLRLTARLPILPFLRLGFFYEYLRFKRLNHAQTGERNLGDPLLLHQFGAGIGLEI